MVMGKPHGPTAEGTENGTLWRFGFQPPSNEGPVERSKPQKTGHKMAQVSEGRASHPHPSLSIGRELFCPVSNLEHLGLCFEVLSGQRCVGSSGGTDSCRGTNCVASRGTTNSPVRAALD